MCTFASAKRGKPLARQLGESSLTDLHRQTNSTRRGVCLSLFLGIWDSGMPWVLCIEPSILETGIKVHRPDDEAVLGQIMAAAF